MIKSLIVRRLQLARYRLIELTLIAVILLSLWLWCARFDQLDPECDHKRDLLLDRLCAKPDYSGHSFQGGLCDPLCRSVGKRLRLLSCPNRENHDGKQFVFAAIDYRLDSPTKMIVKLRELEAEDDPTSRKSFPSADQLSDNQITERLQSILNATFDSNRFQTEHLSFWLTTDRVRSLSHDELYVLYVLAQQHEFVLSATLNGNPTTRHNQVFPQVIDHCNELYALQYVPTIFSRDLLLPWIQQDAIDRVKIARALAKFLLRFERLSLNFDICDPKIEHFGMIDYDWKRFFSIDRKHAIDSDFFDKYDGTHRRILLIDSDMVYHRKTVAENIASIQNCEHDHDCDFNHCRGRCVNQTGAVRSCRFRTDEDNLHRFCRTILFIKNELNDSIDHSDEPQSSRQFGLLGVLPSVDAGQLDRIRQLCNLPIQLVDSPNPKENDRTLSILRLIEVIQQMDQLITVLEQ